MNADTVINRQRNGTNYQLAQQAVEENDTQGPFSQSPFSRRSTSQQCACQDVDILASPLTLRGLCHGHTERPFNVALLLLLLSLFDVSTLLLYDDSVGRGGAAMVMRKGGGCGRHGRCCSLASSSPEGSVIECDCCHGCLALLPPVFCFELTQQMYCQSLVLFPNTPPCVPHCLGSCVAGAGGGFKEKRGARRAELRPTDHTGIVFTGSGVRLEEAGAVPRFDVGEESALGQVHAFLLALLRRIQTEVSSNSGSGDALV